MAIVSQVGFRLSGLPPSGASGRVDERWFGEAASKIVVAGSRDQIAHLEAVCGEHGVSFTALGEATGTNISFESGVAVNLADATTRFESGLVDLS
jgi:hypothetical protein